MYSNLKVRAASSLYGVGASIINDVIMIEGKEGWRPLTEKEHDEVVKNLIVTQKEDAKEKISLLASDTRAKVVSQVDQYKLASWNGKYQRAQAVLAGKASEADLTILQAECEQRGLSETPQQLAATQVAKGQDLAMVIAVIDGMEKAALQAAEAASSEHALEALLEELEAKVKFQSLQAKDSEAKASSSKWWTIFKKAQGA